MVPRTLPIMWLFCCYAPLPLQPGHVSKNSGPSAAIVQGWITAWATAVLAVFAIVTAVLAYRAFRKQSQEVRDQAKLLKVQSEQLDEQRKINVIQAEDLRESLKERERLRYIVEREQADAVLFEWWPANQVTVSATAGVPLVWSGSAVLVVENASRRRILKAACRIEPSAGTGLTLAAEHVGALVATDVLSYRAMMSAPVEGSTVALIRAGARFGFLLRFDLQAHADVQLATRFTDDVGLHWQIDQDLHLQQLSNRDDW